MTSDKSEMEDKPANEAPVRINRRSESRYVLYRDCAVTFMGQSVEVTLLNISKGGIAILGTLTDVSPGDHLEIAIDGVITPLDAFVVNVNFGRIGAKFDLTPNATALWDEEFPRLITEGTPLE
jgi:hypothetical protein